MALIGPNETFLIKFHLPFSLVVALVGPETALLERVPHNPRAGDAVQLQHVAIRGGGVVHLCWVARGEDQAGLGARGMEEESLGEEIEEGKFLIYFFGEDS